MSRISDEVELFLLVKRAEIQRVFDWGDRGGASQNVDGQTVDDGKEPSDISITNVSDMASPSEDEYSLFDSVSDDSEKSDSSYR
jgi:hypothetical protein